MTASRYLRFLVAAAATIASGTTEQIESCPSDLNHAKSPSCKSTSIDTPLAANSQLQSAARLQRGPDDTRGSANAPLEVSSASLASISRKSGSKQMRMYSSAEEVKRGVERMKATWDSSMDEINGLISGIADHDSASQDTCSTQLIEYKKKLTKIHESTISISIAVNSTTSQVSIFDKECHEKDEELKEIETVHLKRVKKCTTERRVEKKTLETLRYDMTSMKKVARAHIHLKKSMLLQQQTESPPRRSLADVRGMVKKTKETASKLQTCLAKAHLDNKKSDVSLSEENSEDASPPPRCEGIKPRCFPVLCTHAGWACGEANKCPPNQPRCHPISCVDGHWKCGLTSDSAYEACQDKGRGDSCQFTPPNTAGKKVGKCVIQPIHANFLALDDEEEDAVGGGAGDEETHGIEAESNLDEDSDDEDVQDDEDDEEDIEEEESDDEEGEENEQGLEVFLQEDSEASPKPDSGYGNLLKCVPAGSPTECQEVVIELEHQFTESYVSLTRMIEEYEVVTHSTVCEETVEEEYTEESTAIQDEANEVCSEVQTTMSKLEHFKFEYQSTLKTEHKLESSIKVLVKQCGSLSSTEEYLTTVTSTLTALGDCPGLGEVQFQLPTWTGDWARFKQNRQKSNKWNDKRMLQACVKKFGQGARPAEVSEIDGQSIEGMPKKNTAPSTILGACPDCKGKKMPGSTKSGYGRICWDAGSRLSRKGRRRDCGGGPRSILCVLDAA